jgi:ubiquinone biosynthesis protein UbiJ
MTSVLSPFERLLNKAITSDPETHDRLALFEDRSIAIVVTDLKQHILVTIHNSAFHLALTQSDEASLTIKAPLFSLIKLTQNPDSLFSTDITINGDVQFAKQLQDLLDGFDFDWEAQIARVTGDTLAYPIAHGLKQFSAWASSRHQTFQINMAEYLTEEVRMLPVQFQVDDYINNIDKLRADSDRMEARVKRLEMKLK